MPDVVASLREALEPRIDRFYVTNDVNAATLGEMWQGGAKGRRRGVGTGIRLRGQASGASYGRMITGTVWTLHRKRSKICWTKGMGT